MIFPCARDEGYAPYKIFLSRARARAVDNINIAVEVVVVVVAYATLYGIYSVPREKRTSIRSAEKRASASAASYGMTLFFFLSIRSRA